MSLYLVSNNENSKIYKYMGKRYRRDYDMLQIKKKIELNYQMIELLELEKNLTLLEEIENKEKPTYKDFIFALRLKRKLRYDY